MKSSADEERVGCLRSYIFEKKVSHTYLSHTIDKECVQTKSTANEGQGSETTIPKNGNTSFRCPCYIEPVTWNASKTVNRIASDPILAIPVPVGHGASHAKKNLSDLRDRHGYAYLPRGTDKMDGADGKGGRLRTT